MPTLNIKDIPESKMVKLVDLSEDSVNKIAEAVVQKIAEPVKHGQWIKMSDADGIYYVCSECGNELPRVIDSFDPQFDLFPKLKCIDKTTYCPHCGTKMENANDT